MKTLVIVIAALFVIAGGAFALMRNSDKKVETVPTTQTTPAESTNNDTQQNAGNTDQQAGAVTITYGNDGFTPTTLTVKSGATITIKNTSSNTLQFASDPHPAHTENSELNAGSISAGESKDITVKKTGTFGFHNHLNPSDTGTITVE